MCTTMYIRTFIYFFLRQNWNVVTALEEILFNFFYILFLSCFCLFVLCGRTPRLQGRGHLPELFSPSTIRVLKIELRLLGWMPRAFWPAEPFYQPPGVFRSGKLMGLK